VQQRSFVRGFDQIGLASGPIVMFDDIRLLRMSTFWQETARPKSASERAHVSVARARERRFSRCLTDSV
jgi:hypothetical protein